MGEGGVQHVELVGVGEEAQPHRGGVDQGVGPAELQRVVAFFENHPARLADEGEVFAVVDGELHRVACGHGGEVDLVGAGGVGDCGQQQGEQEEVEAGQFAVWA